MDKGFVDLGLVIPGLQWDAKYATNDNFTGRPVDGYRANRVVGTVELAEALARALALARNRGYGLLIWDAYRPARAVRDFLRWAEEPEDFRTKARHYPNIEKAQMLPLGYVAEKSGHCRGSAVDLTLIELSTGLAADMGGIFDLMDPVSHHGAQGISEEAQQNRALLRDILIACGFNDYRYEWWHYALAKEPYPDTYFDFTIDNPR